MYVASHYKQQGFKEFKSCSGKSHSPSQTVIHTQRVISPSQTLTYSLGEKVWFTDVSALFSALPVPWSERMRMSGVV